MRAEALNGGSARASMSSERAVHRHDKRHRRRRPTSSDGRRRLSGPRGSAGSAAAERPSRRVEHVPLGLRQQPLLAYEPDPSTTLPPRIRRHRSSHPGDAPDKRRPGPRQSRSCSIPSSSSADGVRRQDEAPGMRRWRRACSPYSAARQRFLFARGLVWRRSRVTPSPIFQCPLSPPAPSPGEVLAG